MPACRLLIQGTVAAALLLSTAGPMMPAPVFADTAANPYAKAGELEAAKSATENKKAGSSSNNAALIAVPVCPRGACAQVSLCSCA
ncbi:MAG: hypothetical protein ACPIOQ_71245 [Promethearchaeia archaeon]